MNHFVFSALTGCVSTLAAGLYFVRKTDRAERLFGFFWLAVAFWTFTVAAQFELLRWIPDRVWGAFLHLGCISVPFVYFHFAVEYSGNGQKLSGAVKVSYTAAILLIAANAFTDFLTSGTSYRDDYAYPTPAVFYPAYILSFQVFGLWATVLLFRMWKQFPPAGRVWLGIFLLIHLLAYGGSMDNYLIMYDTRIFPLYPYGLYLVTVYATLGSWVFVKMRQTQTAQK